jgi:hypothetical protein
MIYTNMCTNTYIYIYTYIYIFTFTYIGAGLSNQGVAIISEFISSARVMRGALIVNPWKVEEVKKALKLALEMSPSDRMDRMRRYSIVCSLIVIVFKFSYH